MATTLSYGYVKPVTTDLGSVFFPAIEADIQQLNDHVHDGTTSAKIGTTTTISSSSGSWVTVANRHKTYTVTVPNAANATTSVMVKLLYLLLGVPQTGVMDIGLRTEWTGTSTIKIYANLALWDAYPSGFTLYVRVI